MNFEDLTPRNTTRFVNFEDLTPRNTTISISYTYNDFGCTACAGRGMDRIAQEVTPRGTIDYTYDNVGRRKTMQILGQPVVSYDYYNNGWLENVRQVVNSVEHVKEKRDVDELVDL